MVPVVLTLLLLLLGPSVLRRKNDRIKTASLLVSFTLRLLNFFYFSIAANTISVFDCQFNGLHNVLTSEPSIVCDLQDPYYSQMFVPAILYCVFYLLGIPVVYMVVLYRNRDEIRRIQSKEPQSTLSSEGAVVSLEKSEEESLVAIKYGFLYKNFKPSVGGWGLKIHFCIYFS